MKRFTACFITAVVTAAASVMSCFSAYADETVISENRTASIKLSDFYEQYEDTLPLNFEINSNFDGFMFYDQLDSNNRATYNKMLSWLTPDVSPLTISLPETVAFSSSSSDMSSWTSDEQEEFWKLVLAAVKTGQTAFTLDYPEVFWFDETNIDVSISYNTSYSFRKRAYTFRVTKVILTPGVAEEYSDTETAAQCQERLAQGIEDIEVLGDDRYQKVKFIHDYIAKAVTYNKSAPYLNTAYGMFVEPYQIVCEGYSEAVKLLCDKEGIPCICVVGNVDISNKSAHEWNYIQMEDGKWYALDCTWDDLDNETNPIKYQYFLVGSDTFNARHTPDTTYVTYALSYPELSETAYVYNSGIEQTTTAVTTSSVTTTTTVSTSVSAETKETTASTAKTSVSTVVTTISTAIPTAASSKPTGTTAGEAGDDVLKGDFSKNGIINLTDVVILQQKLIGAIPIESDDFRYELNGDGKLNVFDFVALLRILKE